MKCHRCKEYNSQSQTCECEIPDCEDHEFYLPSNKWLTLKLLLVAVVFYGALAAWFYHYGVQL